MVGVVPRYVVALCPESFDKGFRWPALECESTLFDAPYGLVPRNLGFLGLSNCFVCGFYAAVEDGGGLPFLAADLC